MSQIAIIRRVGLLLALTLVFLSGCGTANDGAPFDADADKHAAGWTKNHVAAARQNITTCRECHGDDLSGGISKVSCSECHMGGSFSAHPLSWAAPIALNHSGFVTSSGTGGCATDICHGKDLLGGVTGPSCTSCHIGGTLAIHPADWEGVISTKHGEYVNANTTSSCANMYCHGTRLKGVAGISPACNACHAMP